jgi:hypothetical protein
MSVYHYTSAKQLEAIIASGELRPSDAKGLGVLWATTAETIDLTALYHREPIVARFTLWRDDFEPWGQVRSQFTRKEVKHLEDIGVMRGASWQNWYVRAFPLPRRHWRRIDIRDQRWQPYQSAVWQQRGSWQLGRMPWYDEWTYQRLGIDLGDDRP